MNTSYFYKLKNILKNLLFTISFILISTSSFAQLNPNAVYYTGEVETKKETPDGIVREISTCYLESVKIVDGSAISIRFVSALQHFSENDELIFLALGPYDANFIQRNGLTGYAYLDRADAAPVKSATIFTNNAKEFLNYSVRYWHAEAGHHDPIACSSLTEVTTQEEMLEVEEAFTRFQS